MKALLWYYNMHEIWLGQHKSHTFRNVNAVFKNIPYVIATITVTKLVYLLRQSLIGDYRDSMSLRDDDCNNHISNNKGPWGTFSDVHMSSTPVRILTMTSSFCSRKNCDAYFNLPSV